MASPYPFVDPAFNVPETLKADDFVLRMLTVNDVVKDYDAVMASAEELKKFEPGADWPEGLTLEENLIDLGWHQREFIRRTSFAYTVVAPDESKVLGCAYINPTRKQGFDVEVYSWARETPIGTGLDLRLHNTVKAWLADVWPFKAVAFPGREVSWDVWNTIPDEKR